MSITRITKFEAKEELRSNLKEFLGTIISLVEQYQGCKSCRVLQNQENQNEFLCIEEWVSVLDHQTAAKNIPPKMLETAMALLAKPPSGLYYSE